MTALIFISYARADAAAAQVIQSELTELGLPTWLDTTEISPGESFVAKIDQGLSEASYVLSLLSRRSVGAEWTTREWSAAIATRTTVVPVLLDDVQIPALLAPLTYIDFRDAESGIQRLRDFFDSELKPLRRVSTRSVPRGELDFDLLRSLSPREVRLVAIGCLSDSDLSAFLIDAEMSPGDLEGNSLNQRILNLLHQVRRDGLGFSFLEWLALERHRCFQHQIREVRSSPRWQLRLDQD